MKAPGWFDDPEHRYGRRWWDGTNWTEWVALLGEEQPRRAGVPDPQWRAPGALPSGVGRLCVVAACALAQLILGFLDLLNEINRNLDSITEAQRDRDFKVLTVLAGIAWVVGAAALVACLVQLIRARRRAAIGTWVAFTVGLALWIALAMLHPFVNSSDVRTSRDPRWERGVLAIDSHLSDNFGSDGRYAVGGALLVADCVATGVVAGKTRRASES